MNNRDRAVAALEQHTQDVKQSKYAVLEDALKKAFGEDAEILYTYANETYYAQLQGIPEIKFVYMQSVPVLHMHYKLWEPTIKTLYNFENAWAKVGQVLAEIDAYEKA